MSYSENRLARLRQAMREADVDAFLIRDTSSIYWLTAFDKVFDTERAHALLVTETSATLHTDSRYAHACEKAASNTEIVIDASNKTHAAFALSLLDRQEAHACSLGIEDDISLREYRMLEKAADESARPVALLEKTQFLTGLRAVKDAEEIRRMRVAQSITDAAFAHISAFIHPGLTEREVQLELEGYMLANGAEGLAFSSIVACGENGASPHAIPGDTLLSPGQCVVLDFGAKALGYCSDMTRTVFLGEPDQEKRDAYAALRRANEEVAALLKPGVTGAEAHTYAEDVLADTGFKDTMGHGLGHGVGIDVHEQPTLSSKNAEPLCVGNVVTVEPGIYLSGKFGMRLEDFGVITCDGFDVFTQSSHDMVII